MPDLPLLTKAIQDSPLIEWVGHDGITYPFRVFPFGEKSTKTTHDLIFEISSGFVDLLNSLEKPDYLLTITPTGSVWGILLAEKCGFDVAIGRNESVNADTSFKIESGGPHGQEIYMNSVKEGDRVVLVDDVVATAKNITAIATEFLKRNITILGVITIVTKGESYKQFEKEFNVSVKALKNLDTTGATL